MVMKRISRAAMALAAALVAVTLAAAPGPAEARSEQEGLARLAAEVGPVQQLNLAMDDMFMRLLTGSGAFDEVAIGQLDLASAIRRGRAALDGAEGRIAALEAQAAEVRISPTGIARIDDGLARIVAFMKDKPAVLRQIADALGRQVAAAEAGDMDEVDRISSELGGVGVIQIDNETATLEFQRTVLSPDHPQFGLTGAWIATNNAMRPLAALGAETDPAAVQRALGALEGAMLAEVGNMRDAIAESRTAIATIRGKTDPGVILGALGLKRGGGSEFIVDVLDEYEDALAVEDRIAGHLAHGAGLFARLAEGDQSDALMGDIVAFDETYARLIGERQVEAGDRMQVLQRLAN